MHRSSVYLSDLVKKPSGLLEQFFPAHRPAPVGRNSLPGPGEHMVPHDHTARRTIYDVRPEDRKPIPRSAYKRYYLPELMSIKKPPLLSSMSTRDFIHMSLYNPFFGYFPTRAAILSLENPIDFNSLWDFQAVLGKISNSYGGQNAATPMWHTPVELFRPFYAEAVARCIQKSHNQQHRGEDLLIYEVGGGNGTMMVGILNFLKKNFSDVYKRTKYCLIEISGSMAARQSKAAKDSGHLDKVKVVPASIFEWGKPEDQPCYVLAFEVIDNFAHELVRHQLDLGGFPVKGMVHTDEFNEFSEDFVPISLENSTDQSDVELLVRAMLLMDVKPQFSPFVRSLSSQIPFSPNLDKPKYVPCMLLAFFEALCRFFPQHHLILSDFSSLPTKVAGLWAPVVQTRHLSHTISVPTYHVAPGLFDIFFPTDFQRAQRMYNIVRSKNYDPEAATKYAYHKLGLIKPENDFFSSITPSQSLVLTHYEFMKKFADLAATKTRGGDNPLLDFYKNASFLLS